jgi:hypothetical protein
VVYALDGCSDRPKKILLLQPSCWFEWNWLHSLLVRRARKHRLDRLPAVEPCSLFDGMLALMCVQAASGFVLMGENLTVGTGAAPLNLPGQAHRWSFPANSGDDSGVYHVCCWCLPNTLGAAAPSLPPCVLLVLPCVCVATMCVAGWCLPATLCAAAPSLPPCVYDASGDDSRVRHPVCTQPCVFDGRSVSVL